MEGNQVSRSDPDEGKSGTQVEGDRARRAILELAVEDAYALWELEDTIRQALALSDRATRTLTSETLLQLVKESLVELGLRSTPTDPAVPVAPELAKSIVELDRWWEITEEGAVVYATPAGVAAYRAIDAGDVR